MRTAAKSSRAEPAAKKNQRPGGTAAAEKTGTGAAGGAAAASALPTKAFREVLGYDAYDAQAKPYVTDA